MIKILICSPVHQKPKILREFLHGLSKLKLANEDLNIDAHFFFIDDNEDPEASEMLDNFKQKHPQVRVEKNTYGNVYNPSSHVWRDEVIIKVARNKNKFLDYARENEFDYIFLIDSDLVVHPQTLLHLASANCEIISEVFWTSWQEGTMEMPQVWLYDMYEFTSDKSLSQEAKTQKCHDFIHMLKNAKGFYPVGGLGACTLVSKSALAKGVSFEKIYNLTFWGEDRHFCIRAAALGIKLIASTYYPPLHIYRDSDLERVPDFWADALHI